MDDNQNLVQIREAARLAGCHVDTLRRHERAGDISSRRAANGYRLFDPRDLAKLFSGGTKRQGRVQLDRVHQQVLSELTGYSEADLDVPCDEPHALFDTRLGALFFCSLHEMMHAGQIGLL